MVAREDHHRIECVGCCLVRFITALLVFSVHLTEHLEVKLISQVLMDQPAALDDVVLYQVLDSLLNTIKI